MMPLRNLLAALALITLSAGCAGLSPVDTGDLNPGSPCGNYPEVKNFLPANGFGPVGTDTTFDMACWNIENFPKHSSTVDRVFNIITTLDIDLYSVEEIADTNSFRALVARLPEYGGLFSPDTYGRSYQKTGIIYKKSIVTVDSVKVPAEFKSHSSYEFAGRPPMDIALTTHSNGLSYSFHLIPVHLKAGSGNEQDAARRRAGTQLIHDYMDKMTLAQPGVDFMVAGDWNDSITEPMSYNSFPSFLSDTSDYVFLSMALAGQSEYTSHPLGLIDNILVNSNACPDFTKGRITTLRLDLAVAGYRDYVSDHRPVMVSTPLFK